jgi:phosphate starvation-inducible PhoH-like protein
MGRSRRNRLYFYEDEEEDEDFSYTPSFSGMEGWINQHKSIKPKNPVQATYIKALEDPSIPIVVAVGSAGTGKTFVANSFAMERLKSNTYQKIVITRPMISVDERQSFGALPGDVQSKMMPFLLPIYDVIYRYISSGKLQSLISKGTIEICSLLHMRGRSFENSLIIADEMQNATPAQMLMLLTRIGENSKLIINGDPVQHDRGNEVNGLVDLMNRLDKSPSNDIAVIKFQDMHIERHPIIKRILALYK